MVKNVQQICLRRSHACERQQLRKVPVEPCVASRMMASPPALACSAHRWAPARPIPDNVCDAPISRMGARATYATTDLGQTDGRSHELDASEEPIFCTSLSHVETMAAGLEVRRWPIAGCQR